MIKNDLTDIAISINKNLEGLTVNDAIEALEKAKEILLKSTIVKY